MAELRLAGNYIDWTGIFDGYGHLQVVLVDSTAQLEIEVQAPPSGFLGSWVFEPERSDIEDGEVIRLTIDTG